MTTCKWTKKTITKILYKTRAEHTVAACTAVIKTTMKQAAFANPEMV